MLVVNLVPAHYHPTLKNTGFDKCQYKLPAQLCEKRKSSTENDRTCGDSDFVDQTPLKESLDHFTSIHINLSWNAVFEEGYCKIIIS